MTSFKENVNVGNINSLTYNTCASYNLDRISKFGNLNIHYTTHTHTWEDRAAFAAFRKVIHSSDCSMLSQLPGHKHLT